MENEYYRFMMKWVDEDNRIGDLARDIKADKNFPKNGSHAEIIKYLFDQSNIMEVHETIRESWEIFENE